jgi:hypothetical protein
MANTAFIMTLCIDSNQSYGNIYITGFGEAQEPINSNCVCLKFNENQIMIRNESFT